MGGEEKVKSRETKYTKALQRKKKSMMNACRLNVTQHNKTISDSHQYTHFKVKNLILYLIWNKVINTSAYYMSETYFNLSLENLVSNTMCVNITKCLNNIFFLNTEVW